ncbi:hypothetical protein ACQPZK_05990 [Micromonospora sp. CA-249363]|uniref:hypothetical protein n=1 Tax=Micromonospora sp. CA-249363 TaxID=3239963 RepID=UPI003D8EEE26
MAGYRRADGLVPVGAVLLIAQDAEREERLQADLFRGPLPNVVATTTRQVLYRHWPDEPVWQVRGETGRHRLVELGT